jgi:hypothetical protein
MNYLENLLFTPYLMNGTNLTDTDINLKKTFKIAIKNKLLKELGKNSKRKKYKRILTE